jgi:predicted nucleotidyltransferase
VTEAPAQLEDVVALVETVAGPALVGAWLFGSGAMGGFRPDSDLDVLVVTRRSLDDGQRRDLVAGLLGISGRGRRRPDDRAVELTSMVAEDVVPWRYPPAMDFQYGQWLRAEYEAGLVPARQVAPDLATLLTMARAWSVPVRGPSLAEVLEPVPVPDLRRAMTDGVPTLLADLVGDERNVLLTLARAWLTLSTGEIRSKDAAAGWAIERLPGEPGAVLAHARAIYLGEAPERWEPPLADAIPATADALVSRIEEAVRPRS